MRHIALLKVAPLSPAVMRISGEVAATVCFRSTLGRHLVWSRCMMVSLACRLFAIIVLGEPGMSPRSPPWTNFVR